MVYLMGAVALLLTIGGTIYYSHLTGKAVNWMINYLTPTTLAESIAVFVLFTSRKWSPGQKTRCGIVAAARVSFGVYLVHVLYIRIAVSHGIDSSWLHPSYFIPVYTMLIFAVSCVTAWVMSKIPYLNRYLV
ncbi:MAG: hypothetical protein IJ775_02000 [Muribaculaceae bacterium]|nr:hypothetical protein [Muribaculaceae bacterium]